METIFGTDEIFGDLNPNWGEEELLSQRAVFFLKDIASILALDKTYIIRLAKKQISQVDSPHSYNVMGVYKIWGHWHVRMTVFGPYYLSVLKGNTISDVKTGWDANILLSQNGNYHFVDVVKIIPFSYSKIRYQVRKCPNPRVVMGIWREPVANKYVVYMPVFSKWIKGLWSANS